MRDADSLDGQAQRSLQAGIGRSGANRRRQAGHHAPTMLQKLGSPIVAGRTTSATLNTNNDAGDADLTIPLQGPFGKGKLHVVAERKAYKWAYREMRFVADGSGETVDLRTATDVPTRP